MKTMKQILASMVATMMMVAMLVVPASAEGQYEITINGTADGHTYEAYQIFTGAISIQDGGKKVLSSINWGEGVDSEDEDFLPAIKGISYTDNTNTVHYPFANVTNAQSVADELAKFNSNGTVVDQFAIVMGDFLTNTKATSDAGEDNEYTISNLAAGYYLIKDQDESLPGGDDQNDNDLYTKYLIAVVGDAEVTVKGSYPTVTKKVADVVGGPYEDATDVLVKDYVYFELIGTLPSNFSDYESYTYIFTDESSAAIELDPDSVKVYRKIHNVNDMVEIDNSSYTLSWKNDTMTVSFADLKEAIDTSENPITFALTDNIVVRYSGILYDNNTNSIIVGGNGNRNTATLTYSNDPNEQNEDATGITNSSEVAVYTYQLDIKKVSTDDKPLAGAQFHLVRKTTYPEQFAAVDSNGYLVGWVTDENDASLGQTLFTTDSTGYIHIKGIDEGSYWLREHKAPDGYNMLTSDVNAIIASGFDHTDTRKLSTLTMNGSAANCNIEAGTAEISIENKSGATLPETGGIGTTIFYIAGGALMIGAAAVLITKKRGTQK